MRKERPKIKTDRINLRVSPELKAAMEEAAAREDRSLSTWILAVAREAIKKAEDEARDALR